MARAKASGGRIRLAVAVSALEEVLLSLRATGNPCKIYAVSEFRQHVTTPEAYFRDSRSYAFLMPDFFAVGHEKKSLSRIFLLDIHGGGV
jgi:hypothetical protein